MLLMLFLIGTFGLNFPIFISTMAVGVFHAGASDYGLLSSMMAIGIGRRRAARRAGREQPRFALLLIGAAGFGVGCSAGGADARATGCSALALVVIGVAAQTFTTLDQQPGAAVDRAGHARPRDGDPARHRAGRHADRRADRRLGGEPFGPRWALAVGAFAGLAAAGAGFYARSNIPSVPSTGRGAQSQGRELREAQDPATREV